MTTSPARASRRTRTLLKTLHLWIGLSLGIALALVTLSGTVLLFEDPLFGATHPQLTERPLPSLAAQGTSLDHLLHLPEGKSLRSLSLPSEELPVWEGNAKGGDRFYFDATSGELLAHRSAGSDGLLILMNWHTKLLSGEIGETILGIVALGGLTLLISGTCLYWPGRRRVWTHLKPHLRPATLRWASWHRMVGFAALPLLLVMIGTGTTMAYRGAVRNGLMAAFHESRPARPAALQAVGTAIDWPAVLAAAQHAAPAGRLSRIMLPAKPEMPVTIRVHQPGEWHPDGRSSLWLDPYNATVVGSDDARAAGRGSRISNALYPIHTAAVGGVLWHTVAAITGLMPTFLLCTGALFWWTRRRHRRKAS
jgi:uncharacterized iron-regulated membrane protein